MDLSGVAAILMAVAAVITAMWAIRNNKRGEAREDVQEAAAAKLGERIENYKELSSYADRLEQQLTRAQEALDARDAKHTTDMGRIEQAWDRRAYDQANRCRAQLASAMSTVHMLQGIVRDEIAVEAARTAGDDVDRHTTTDHPEQP